MLNLATILTLTRRCLSLERRPKRRSGSSAENQPTMNLLLFQTVFPARLPLIGVGCSSSISGECNFMEILSFIDDLNFFSPQKKKSCQVRRDSQSLHSFDHIVNARLVFSFSLSNFDCPISEFDFTVVEKSLLQLHHDSKFLRLWVWNHRIFEAEIYNHGRKLIYRSD